MKIKICLLLTFGLGFAPLTRGQVAVAAPVFPGELASKLEATLTTIHDDGEFPGMTLGVVLPDGADCGLAVGVSNRKSGRKMKSSDRMLQGSVGKTYVAAVALQLIADEKLDLKRKVSHYLGKHEWYPRIPNSAAITVRQLMTHTSGVMRYEFKPTFTEDLKRQPDKVWKPEELLAYVLDEKGSFPAGEGWEYSDTNYILLGMIIEKITGSTLFAEIKRRLIVPLRLKDTIPSDARVLKGVVQGYTNPRSPFGLGETVMVDGKLGFNPQFEWAGGGWASTSLDLARWAKALYEGRAFPKNLLPEAVDGVKARLGPGSRYGLGVIITPSPQGATWGHSGYFPGYLTEMRYYVDHRFTLVCQFNTSNGRSIGQRRSAILDKLAAVVVQELSKPG